MKAKEFIYNLKTVLAKVDSEIQNYTDQHIMYILDEARAVLASQKMERAVSLNQMAQYIDFKPIVAPVSEIGTVGSTRVLRVDIPPPIEYNNGEGIFTVGATDGQDSYSRISYSQLRTALSRKYTAKSPKWFWFNSSIYIINSEIDGLNKVRVRGIFAEPYKVLIANSTYKYLTPFDWEYPMALKDAKAVYQIAMTGDLGWGDTAVQAIRESERKQAREAKYLKEPANAQSR